jgi:hypothetical protein
MTTPVDRENDPRIFRELAEEFGSDEVRQWLSEPVLIVPPGENGS